LIGVAITSIAMTEPPETAPEQGIEQADRTASETQPANDPIDQKAEEGLHECVLTFITGRTITGFLMESRDEDVVLRLEGIDTTYRRSSISSIKFLPPVSERYRDIRDTIEDTDIETRLVLVEWLRTRQAYTLALNELSSILELQPGNSKARTLHAWLEAHIKLVSKSSAPKTNPESIRPAPKRQKAPEIPLLNEQQINLMRVYELDLKSPPKMKVTDETLKSLMLRHPDSFPIDTTDRDEYFKLPEHEKLRLLFVHRERDLYTEVKVLEDPEMMRTFKDTVHARNGWLLNGCATTRCHGGSDAGEFRLFNDRPNSNETAYTNFFIVDHFKLKDGTPLIDHENPARSALLQLATQNANSLRPHPEVSLERPGSRYRPIFRSSRDRKYQQAVNWIKMIYKPRVDYDLGYPPEPVDDEAVSDSP
jgi:hypothetical protein